MEVIQALKERRSIRKFREDGVSDEVLRELFETVRFSPSWANTQVWEFVVVRDAEVKGLLAETLPPGNPSKGAIEKAPVVIAACARRGASGFYRGQQTTSLGDWLLFDMGIALHQLNLAAHALGLGMVHVGLFSQEKAAELLGVPEGFQLVELLPLGYPESAPPTPKRRESAEFLHYEKF